MPKKLEYITIIRDPKKEATPGVLVDETGKKICLTLERPDLGNQRDNPATKTNESSCIPEGEYVCVKYSSPKYPNTWQITGVKGRDKILFHSANYVHQLLGCIATATSIEHNPKLEAPERYFASESKKAFKVFSTLMADKFKLKITSIK